MLRSFIETFKKKNAKKNSSLKNKYSKYHSSRRLSLEHLEPRELLSGIHTWSGYTNGNWSVASNWTGGVPQGSGNTLYFNSTIHTKVMYNDLSSDVSFSYIGFGAANYSITGSSFPINLSGGINADTASGIVINSDLILSSGNHQIQTSNGSGLTISGAISGTGALQIIGSNTVILSGSNSYTGGTTISNGTLRLDASYSLPTGTAVSLSNTSGAYLNINGTTQSIASLNGGGTSGGNVNIGSGTLTISGDAPTNSIYNGVISGTNGNLTKSGSGTLTLNGTSNSYSGMTTINGGVLSVGSALNLGTDGLTFNGGALQITSTCTINKTTTISSGGGTLDVSGSVNYTSSIGGTGALTKIGTGTLTLGAANSYTGGTTINAGTLQLSGGSNRLYNQGAITITGGVLDLGDNGYTQSTSGAVSIRGGTIQNGKIIKSGAAYDGQAGTVSAVLDGSVGLNKTGTGTLLTLSGTNTYTGATTISAGTLALGKNNAIANTSSMTISGSSTTLYIDGFNNTVGPVTLQSGTISGTTGVLSSSAYYVQSGTISVILGDGGALTKSTTGTVTLNKVNTYTGSTTINAGTLALRANNANTIGNTSSITVNGSSAILDIDGNNNSMGPITLQNGGTITGTTGVLSSSAYNVQSGTISAILGGGGALIKSTTGKVILTGSNTYTGTTTISAGTLQAESAASLPGYNIAGKITVNSGGTLTVNTGAAVEWFEADIDTLLNSATFNSGALLGVDKKNPINTTAGITVKYSPGLTTDETDKTAEFYVVLDSQPTDNVTISISSSDITEGTASPSSLTFTNSNWNTQQTVTVTGVDDYIVDGNIPYCIHAAAASNTDTNYNGLNARDIPVINNDNDSYNTIWVTTTSDEDDGDTSSIATLYASPGSNGISLREAILAANNTANNEGEPDRIYFNINATGVQTISPTMALPEIVDAVFISGYNQHDENPMTMIDLDGTSIDEVTGLTLAAGSGGSTIRDLIINNFSNGTGIGVNSSSNVIAGNYIGTNAAGDTALGNYIGIDIEGGGDNIIGGTTPADRNVISGNSACGIFDASVGSNTIIGNYIGTNAAGDTALSTSADGMFFAWETNGNTIGGTTARARNIISGNGDSDICPDGIFLAWDAHGDIIGGTTEAARNVISGNGDSGIYLEGAYSNTIVGNYIGTDATGAYAIANGQGVIIESGSHDNTIGGNTTGARNVISGNVCEGILSMGSYSNTIAGNYIGTDAAGTAAVGNGGEGIMLCYDSYDTIIGGTEAGAGNVISYNYSSGVAVGIYFNSADSYGISILGNSIYSNGGLGIDLGHNGVTANDAGDGDTGANNLQNFPVLTSATAGGNALTIQGSLNSTAYTSFRIEVFANSAANSSGYGEGRRYLGSFDVYTDGNGNISFTQQLSVIVSVGEQISATATNISTHDTSEFALCIPVNS
jgi:CSLREA domain-containing protein